MTVKAYFKRDRVLERVSSQLGLSRLRHVETVRIRLTNVIWCKCIEVTERRPMAGGDDDDRAFTLAFSPAASPREGCNRHNLCDGNAIVQFW